MRDARTRVNKRCVRLPSLMHFELKRSNADTPSGTL